MEALAPGERELSELSTRTSESEPERTASRTGKVQDRCAGALVVRASRNLFFWLLFLSATRSQASSRGVGKELF